MNNNEPAHQETVLPVNRPVMVTSTMGAIVHLLRCVKNRRAQEMHESAQSELSDASQKSSPFINSTNDTTRVIIGTSEERKNGNKEERKTSGEGGDDNERRTDQP